MSRVSLAEHFHTADECRLIATWPWMREFVNVNRLGLPVIKLWAYDHVCLFGWPLPLPTSDDSSFIY